MKFIYGNCVMMHAKIYKDVIGCREVITADCLNINEFRAIHMNTHSTYVNIHKNRSYCLNFIILARNINSLSNLLV